MSSFGTVKPRHVPSPEHKTNKVSSPFQGHILLEHNTCQASQTQITPELWKSFKFLDQTWALLLFLVNFLMNCLHFTLLVTVKGLPVVYGTSSTQPRNKIVAPFISQWIFLVDSLFNWILHERRRQERSLFFWSVKSKILVTLSLSLPIIFYLLWRWCWKDWANNGSLTIFWWR